MTHPLTDRFAETLQACEASGDPNPLAALYAEGSESTNLSKDAPELGVEGARKFWGEYLRAFKSIRSTFHNVIRGDTHGVLEWTSEGELPTGKPIRYRGVSVLEYEGDKVKRFHSYYDSAAFVAAPATTVPAGGQPAGAARVGSIEQPKGEGGMTVTGALPPGTHVEPDPNTAG